MKSLFPLCCFVLLRPLPKAPLVLRKRYQMCLYQARASSASALIVSFFGEQEPHSCSQLFLFLSFLFDVLLPSLGCVAVVCLAVGQCQSPLVTAVSCLKSTLWSMEALAGLWEHPAELTHSLSRAGLCSFSVALRWPSLFQTKQQWGEEKGGKISSFPSYQQGYRKGKCVPFYGAWEACFSLTLSVWKCFE